MSTDVDQLLAKAAQRKARAAEVGASLSESSTPCDPRTGFLAPQIEKNDTGYKMYHCHHIDGVKPLGHPWDPYNEYLRSYSGEQKQVQSSNPISPGV